MGPEQPPLAGMIEVRPDGVYCVPCRRLFRSIGGHLRVHGVYGKHNRSTLQRMFGLPNGSRLASDATRWRNRAAAIENNAVLQARTNPPNLGEVIHAAGIARRLGRASEKQRAASRAIGAGIGAAVLRVARARRHDRAKRDNQAVITCEHCGFTLVVRRRAPVWPWPRFCSRRCRQLKPVMARVRAGRAAWLAAHQARRRGRA